jgi:hypothetical protein
MGWRGARRWLIAVAVLLALPFAVLVAKDVLVYRAVQRIADRRAVVLSWSDVPGLGWMPSPLRYLVRRYYVVRESYDVRVGEVFIGCGTGITFSTWDTPPLPGDDHTLAALPGLDDITKLEVRSSPVTDEGLRHVGALSRLRWLTLEHTNVTGAGLAHFRGLPLAALSLLGSPVDDAGFSALPELPALETINLSETLVAGPGLAHLRRLPALTGLDLSSTKVDDDGLRHLEGMPFTYLNLSKTAVSDAGLPHLERLPRLQHLHLCGTRVSKEAVARSSSEAVRNAFQLCGLLR